MALISSPHAFALFICVIVFMTSQCNAILFPYGTGQGDASLYRNDDGFTNPPVSISGGPNSFTYFGNDYTSVYVCTNGILSFGSGVSSFTPTPFPIASNPVVAPFWGDVDIRQSGNIYYRQSTDSGLLSTVSAAINQAPTVSNFVATWVFIVTWYQVPAYPGGGSQKNTFQAVLATDGGNSFAVFNYQQIQWTYGSASGGTPAQVGFDAGDRQNSEAHDWSRTSSVANMPTTSNIGVTGRLLYRVDLATIQPIDEVVNYCEGVTCSGQGTCQNGASSYTSGNVKVFVYTQS